MKKKLFNILVAASLISYFTSLLIFKLDKNFTYRWLTLFFSLLPLILIAVLRFFSLSPKKKISSPMKRRGFFLILFLAVLSRLIFLKSYPFVSVGDELRDGGLNALEIATGETKNIFGYGRYYAHGLIIPTITAFFYKIFGGSVLVYRLPAALVSVLDIILFYLLLSLVTKNKFASFFGAMTLISLPLHLFYSRTEIVVILSSLFSTLILISLYILTKRKMKNITDYIFLGTLIGFTFNLHASVKAFGIITLTATIMLCFYQWLSGKLKTREISLRLFLLIFFLLVGFGPRLLNTPSLSFFLHTSRVPLAQEKQLTLSSDNIKEIGERYKRSLLVWVSEPTHSWYPDHKPIFNPLLFSLMALGIIVGLAKKNLYLITVFGITLVTHLTNSALTDIINGDHRLAPLYPIGALFVGVGAGFLIGKLKSKVIKFTFVFSLFIFFSYRSFYFFYSQPANKNKDIGDYLSMHAIYFLKKNNNLYPFNDLTFFVSPSNYQKFNYLHYREQYQFFLPEKNILIKENKEIGDNEIYIKNDEQPYLGKTFFIKCNGKKSYSCPLGFKENIILHY